MTLATFFQQYQQRINTYLQYRLDNTACASASLTDALHYSVLNGGKRLRPLLVYAIAYALKHDQFISYLDNADRCAAACEFIHCYSLVHDDLPAMDDDDWRRGQLACHKRFNEADAILVGDGLQALAFAMISEPMVFIDGEQQLTMLSLLANAAGFAGMVGGQGLDLANQTTTLDELVKMHQLKTGALFTAAVELGARCVGCTDDRLLAQLNQFAHHLGLAYQIQDDVLDITQSKKVLGKPQCSDVINGKCTFVSLLGLDAATEYLHTTYKKAHDCLANLKLDNTILTEFVEYIHQRNC